MTITRARDSGLGLLFGYDVSRLLEGFEGMKLSEITPQTPRTGAEVDLGFNR